MIFGDEVIHFHITDEKHGSLNAVCESDDHMTHLRSDEELKAIAYLIAAAPELLAVAQKIKAHGTLSSTWCDELEAAILKATGAKP